LIKLIAFDLDNTLYDEEKGVLYDGVIDVLKKAKKHFKLGLITNGSLQSQENKIKDIKGLFDYAFFMGKNEKFKPDPYAFKLLQTLSALEPHDIAYIGDNPLTDFIPARICGMYSIRVLQGNLKNKEVSEEINADSVFDNVIEAVNILIEAWYGN
jgi:putative hydrolase of the HAD superfamily